MHSYGNAVNPQRMLSTYHAIRQKLGDGSAMLYRYSGVRQEESTFLACAFWLVEAWAEMGDTDQAEQAMQEILATLDGQGNVDIFNEMYDVRSQSWRGNMPQGLSHLALICAAQALSESKGEV